MGDSEPGGSCATSSRVAAFLGLIGSSGKWSHSCLIGAEHRAGDRRHRGAEVNDHPHLGTYFEVEPAFHRAERVLWPLHHLA